VRERCETLKQNIVVAFACKYF